MHCGSGYDCALEKTVEKGGWMELEWMQCKALLLLLRLGVTAVPRKGCWHFAAMCTNEGKHAPEIGVTWDGGLRSLAAFTPPPQKKWVVKEAHLSNA